MVSGIGESTVTVTFTETIVDTDTAALEAVAADEIAEQYDEFAEAAAEDFVSGIDASDISEQLQTQGELEIQTRSITDNLQPLMETDKKNFADFLTSAKELQSDITSMFNNAGSVYAKCLVIARLTLRVMKMPSDIAVSISEKIKGYSKLTTDIINQFKNDPFGINKIKNSFTVSRLALTGAVASIASGAAVSTASAVSGGGMKSTASGAAQGTTSRKDTVEAANTIIELLEMITEFSDTKVSQNVFVDSDSSAYLALNKLVQNSAQIILNAAFALPMRRTIKTDRDRQVIELCAELYGSIENDVIDQFITENNLNINEIELIPMGREVSYYVQNT
jgi:enamine deaminase RidA (YjgF/YER057c/UK114 family)